MVPVSGGGCAELLPRIKIVPLVDIVITHGRNNTTTGGGFHFGKRLIERPVLLDQYDNAQRVDETGRSRVVVRRVLATLLQ